MKTLIVDLPVQFDTENGTDEEVWEMLDRINSAIQHLPNNPQLLTSGLDRSSVTEVEQDEEE